MATPVFQHGKNAFLALGYDITSTLMTGSASATTAITITNGNSYLSGEAPIINGGSRYGLFAGGVPIPLASLPSTSAATAVSAVTIAAGSTILPMYNISPWINDISFPQQIETQETTTFSNAGVKSYIVGLKGYTVSFNGHYDGSSSAIDKWLTDLISFQDNGNFIPWVYGPASPGAFESSTRTADLKYYGVGILTKYDLKSSVSNVVDFDAELQVTGAVVRTTL